MSYAIVGFGKIGHALAKAFARNGIEVSVATTRDPESFSADAAAIGPTIVPKKLAEALKADIIFLAVRFESHPDVAKALPTWQGKIIVDVTNAYGVPPEELGGQPSSKFVAKAFAGGRLVKGFNHLLAGVLDQGPAAHGGRRVVFLASDDAASAAEIGTFTNTCGVDAYRGAGRPEATYALERLIDRAAREMGRDRVELRRRNFIRREEFPYKTPVGLEYDSGDHEATLAIALKTVGWDGFEERRAAACRQGRLRGIGLSTYVEIAGGTPSRLIGQLGGRGGRAESAQVRVHPSGVVTVFSGSHSHGQGHETTFAQLVCERLSVPFESVKVVQGDTDKVPFGRGTAASRSLVIGGSAILRAVDKIVAKGKIIAGHMPLTPLKVWTAIQSAGKKEPRAQE